MLRHEQTERAPAAAEFQNLLSVFKVGVLDGCFRASGFRFGERFFAGRIEAAGVFPRRPKREREEVRRQFIVLPVGGLNMQRDWKLIHFADEFDFARPRSTRKRAARPVDKRGHSQF